MDSDQLHDVLELSLFLLSALTLTLAAAYIGHSLRCKKVLRPRYVWLYVGAIVTATAIWRWLVFILFGLEGSHFASIAELVYPWINPISAALYTLNGVSVLLLAYAGSRRRQGDGR